MMKLSTDRRAYASVLHATPATPVHINPYKQTSYLPHATHTLTTDTYTSRTVDLPPHNQTPHPPTAHKHIARDPQSHMQPYPCTCTLTDSEPETNHQHQHPQAQAWWHHGLDDSTSSRPISLIVGGSALTQWFMGKYPESLLFWFMSRVWVPLVPRPRDLGGESYTNNEIVKLETWRQRGERTNTATLLSLSTGDYSVCKMWQNSVCLLTDFSLCRNISVYLHVYLLTSFFLIMLPVEIIVLFIWSIVNEVMLLLNWLADPFIPCD